MSTSYNHTRVVLASISLFTVQLIVFIADAIQWRRLICSAGTDIDPFNIPIEKSTSELFIVELVCLVYSLAFAVWQTQIQLFFVHNSLIVYQLVAASCLALAGIWMFAFIGALVAYTSRWLLVFFFLICVLQSLLLPYALYHLKRVYEQTIAATSRPPPLMARLTVDEHAKLLDELRRAQLKPPIIGSGGGGESAAFGARRWPSNTSMPLHDVEDERLSAAGFEWPSGSRKNVAFAGTSRQSTVFAP